MSRSLAALAFGFFAFPAAAQVVYEGPSTVSAGNDPRTVVTADFDGDGVSEAVVTHAGEPRVALLRAGDGGALSLSWIETGWAASDAAIADFDADGRADLALASAAEPAVGVFFGDGAGGFRASPRPATGGPATVLRTGDFDGDGSTDLVALRVDDVDLLSNDGSGGFSAAVAIGAPRFSGLIRVAIADFDADGNEDAAVVSRVEGTIPDAFPCVVSVLVGDGAGRFAARDPFPIAGRVRRVEDFIAADFDGDGAMDLAASALGTGVHVLGNDGTGSFDGPFTLLPTLGFASGLAPVDADEDGLVDLFFTNRGFDWSAFGIIARDDDGRFANVAMLATSAWSLGVAAGDFDGDRHFDAIMTVAAPYDPARGFVDTFFNRTPTICRSGTVDLANRSVPAPVLFVNDSTGGPRRRVTVEPHAPCTIFLSSPPAATAPVPYALYAHRGAPAPDERRALPFGIGTVCRPNPLTGGEPRPVAIWNVTGRKALGAPTRAAELAPAIVFAAPQGIGRSGVFFVQGVIADPGSAAARPASVTNGVEIVVR